MTKRNPLKDYGLSQEETPSDSYLNMQSRKVSRIVNPDGTVQEIPTRTKISSPGENGEYVETEVSTVILDAAGRSIPSDLSNVMISHSGLFIGLNDPRATCTSIFHPSKRSRTILVGYDGHLVPGGAICSNCQGTKNFFYIVFGILGLGLVYGLYRALGYF